MRAVQPVLVQMTAGHSIDLWSAAPAVDIPDQRAATVLLLSPAHMFVAVGMPHYDLSGIRVTEVVQKPSHIRYTAAPELFLH